MNDFEELALKTLELVRRARAVGISHEEMVPFQGNPEALEAEIQRRTNEIAGAGWEGQVLSYKIRRKRIAAAYLAGASLSQLATLSRVSNNAIHNMLIKELTTELRLRLAQERTARGRRRAPTWTPTQVSALMGAVSDNDLRTLPVTVVAARMIRAATTEANEDDENDPYLRDEAGAESNRTGQGQDGRGDGDRSETVHGGGDVPSPIGGGGA